MLRAASICSGSELLAGVTTTWNGAIETGRIYATALGVPLETDARLNALNLGIFAGMNEEQNAERLQLYIDHPDTVIPDGESVSGYRQRVDDGIDDWRSRNDTVGPVLVMTHSSGIATYLGKITHGEDGDLENCSAMMSPAGVAEIDGDDDVKVVVGEFDHGDAA